MSKHTTTTTPATQDQTPEQGTPLPLPACIHEAAVLVPWWATATEAEQRAVDADYRASGLELAEYMEYAAGFVTAAALLADAGTPTPATQTEGTTQQPLPTREDAVAFVERELLREAELAAQLHTVVAYTAPAEFEGPALAVVPWWCTTAPADKEAVYAGFRLQDKPLAEYLTTLATKHTSAASVLGTEEVEEEPTPDVDTEAVLKEASVVLRKCGTANRRGETDLLDGKLEAGRYATEYLGLRLSLGHDRAAVVKALDGHLCETSPQEVDAGDLLGTYHAYQLLAVAQGLDQAPEKGKRPLAYTQSYTAYRDQWSKLVQRVPSKTAEQWVLVPGVEEYARQVFRGCCEKGHKGRPVADAVADVVLKVREVEQAAAKAERERVAAAKEAADRKAKAERERSVELATKAKALEQAGDKPAAEAVRVEAVQATQEATKATQQAQQLEAKVEAADATVQAAEAKVAKAKAKLEPKPAAKPAPKLDAKPAGTPPAGEQPALPTKPAPELDTDADAEELGVECAAVIAECDAPDTALESLLLSLVASKQLGAVGNRAAQAALAILRRPAKSSSPAEGTATPAPVAAV